MVRRLGLSIILLLTFSLNTLAQNKQIEAEELPKGLNFSDLLCGGHCVPTIKDLNVGDVSPNELPRYRFFAEGKLKNIRLGISTRDDVKKLFGSTCEEVCNYDKDWNIWVNYLEPLSPETISKPKENKDVTYILLQPKEKFVGTLRFVRLIPKKNISFAKVVFSESFGNSTSISFGHSFDLKAVHSESQVYVDGYGLKYSVFLRETFNNLPKRERRKPTKSGSLQYIEYEFPKSLESTVYDVIEK